MATFTYFQNFGTYPPAAMAAGDATPTVHTATEMTYLSTQGYTVSLRGTGFAYDDDFGANDGLVSRIVVSLNGVTYADFTGLNAALPQLWSLSTGITNGPTAAPPNMPLFFNVLQIGNDSILGSGFSDNLSGGIGNDSIMAGASDDQVSADAGNDLLDGGLGGKDTLTFEGSYSDFTAFRGVNLNTTTGLVTDCWGGRDSISGFEVYKDSLFNDTMVGSGLSGERFYLTRGNDSVDGGGGQDLLYFVSAAQYGAKHGVNVNLATGMVRDAWGGTDRVANIEHVRGTSFADTMTGAAVAENLIGGDGVDVINGGAGFDTDEFWLADEVGHGAHVDLSKAVNVLDDGFGNAETAIGIEGFVGTMYDDVMLGNTAANLLSGSDTGNDTLSGAGGADTLQCFAGNDLMTGGLGADEFWFQTPPPDADLPHITDFVAGVDEIVVAPDFGGGLGSGALLAGQFRSGAGVTLAATLAQRFVYDTTTGNLYFDADGKGGAASVKFAVLDNHAAITFAEISIL
jgi:serralysin